SPAEVARARLSAPPVRPGAERSAPCRSFLLPPGRAVPPPRPNQPIEQVAPPSSGAGHGSTDGPPWARDMSPVLGKLRRCGGRSHPVRRVDTALTLSTINQSQARLNLLGS